jgi:Co/Zn/Cd efflux system component
MHKTAAGEKRKALKTEALGLERDARATMQAADILPDARREARRMEGRADELKAEAEDLKGAARLEDLHLWQMEKVKSTKKGSKTYHYWMASWREGDKVRNVHLGSCKKVDYETALQKARRLKAEALAIKP